MKRRDFITLLGGAAATWAPAARAQGDRVRHVAALGLATLPPLVATLREELQKLGWTEGHNLRLDVRYADDAAALRVASEEVVKSAPEVIFAFTGAVTRVVHALTRTIPIVFAGGGDPVGWLVSNVAKPEGNITGFANLFGTLGGKWVELLKETAPRVTRVASLFNPDRSLSGLVFASTESAATQLGATAVRIPVRNRVEIESAVRAFAAEPNGALIYQGPRDAGDFDGTIQRLALSLRLPMVSQFPGEGVLIAYGADPSDLVRGAASYIDRILRGAKPGELPVQYPTRYRLVINLKAAKAIGLTVPESVLLRADEVIE